MVKPAGKADVNPYWVTTYVYFIFSKEYPLRSTIYMIY